MMMWHVLPVSSVQVKSLEAVLAGALRREQEAELASKKSAAEIEHLFRMVFFVICFCSLRLMCSQILY